MRHFANRLVAYQASAMNSSKTVTPASFPVCEKLRLCLGTYLGKGGFHALMARSLALSIEEVPRLGGVHVQADGSLAGLAELQAQHSPADFARDEVILVAQLLGLMLLFIGEKLTLHLVRDVWPDLPFGTSNFNATNLNEKSS